MKNREIKANLLKLLNVNAYALALIENYEGNSLPDTFNIERYANALDLEDDKDSFVSTLSSFTTIEKYAKINLVTPFGVLIDAFMIVDKAGSPCILANHTSDQDESDQFKK